MNHVERLEAEEKELMKLAFGDPSEQEEKAGDDQSPPTEDKAPDTREEEAEVSAKEDTPQAPMQQQPDSLATELAQVNKRFFNYKATKDKQLFDLRTQVSTLSSQLANALDKVSQLSTAQAVPEKDFKYFTEEDERVLGKPAMEVLARTRKEDYERNIAPILAAEEERKQQEVKNLKNLSKKQAAKAVADFELTLTGFVPKWREVLKEPEFHAFIKTTNEWGQTYESVFRNAERIREAGILASIFKEYISDKGRNPELDRHIAPPQGSATVQPKVDESGKLVITKAFIDDYYDKAAKGYFNQSTELYKKGAEIEAAIDAHIQQSFRR